jgi:hypothetical protein
VICDDFQSGITDTHFFLNYIDDIVGESPVLLITDDEKLLKRTSALDAYPENIHFITTAAYLDLPRHD